MVTGQNKKRTIAITLVLLLLLLSVVVCFRITGWGGKGVVPVAPPAKRRFDPDREKDSIAYDRLAEKYGPVPLARKKYRIGAVLKFFGNQYWQLLAAGMQSRADELKIELDLRAASTESDPKGQLAVMEEMIKKGYDALLVSPQTDKNLTPAVRKARTAGILIINVNDAVLEDAEHWVGPNQYENGVRAAGYYIGKMPKGGKVAVIKGLADVYAVNQRTRGFIDTLEGTGIKMVAIADGFWDLQKSLKAAERIIRDHPDIKGFYCNNDIMALGAMEAVRNAGRIGAIMIIGTDGIDAAYDSIRAGELTATVDSFPFITGQVAVETALRLLEGQPLPRAVYSPQDLITEEKIHNPLP
jgi:ribose transport system substrate-binding protein